MRGRKPTPIEQRVREGNPRKHAVPEPILVSGRPMPNELDEPPDYLPADAKDFWRDSIARLVDVGILDRVDQPALEMLATQYARVRQAGRVLASEGHYAKSANGTIITHPAVRIERDATATFMRLAEHFALTPIARTRLGLAELHRRSLQTEMSEALGGPELIDG